MRAVQRCSWLPVDTLATVILDLTKTLSSSSSSAHNDSPVYNLLNPHTFSWSELLQELHASGLHFTSKPFVEWLSLLKDSATKGEEADNPAVKLLEYFETNYSAQENLAGEGIRFETGAAERDSLALKEAPRCIKGGLVRKFIGRWMERWGGFGGGRVNGYRSAGKTAGVEDGTGSKLDGVLSGGHQIRLLQ